MRPGPGLVVMALAFISGARRGSTSTSSKSSSSATSSSSPPAFFTSTASDNDLEPLTPSLLFPAFLGGGGVLISANSPSLSNHPLQDSEGENRKEEYNYIYNSHLNLLPLASASDRSIQSDQHLRLETLSGLKSSSRATRQTRIIRSLKIGKRKLNENRHETEVKRGRDRESDSVGNSESVIDSESGSGSGLYDVDDIISNVEAKTSASLLIDDTAVNINTEKISLRYPTNSADTSQSLDEDDILALVAEDDLLSEESFDRLTKFTDDKIGYVIIDDYDVVNEDTTSGVSEGFLTNAPEKKLQKPRDVKYFKNENSAGSENGTEDHYNFQNEQEHGNEKEKTNVKENAILNISGKNFVVNKENKQNNLPVIVDTSFAAAFSENGLSHTIATDNESNTRNINWSIFESESPLTRLNPWISACDLAQPGTAPDLQGQCSAGTLPVAWVDEGPGPPTCPISCEKLKMSTVTKLKTKSYNNNSNLMNNYKVNIKTPIGNLKDTATIMKVRRDLNKWNSNDSNQTSYGDEMSISTKILKQSEKQMLSTSPIQASSFQDQPPDFRKRENQANKNFVKSNTNEGETRASFEYPDHNPVGLKYKKNAALVFNNKEKKEYFDYREQQQQQKEQQCLDYLGDTEETSPAHLCTFKSPGELADRLRSLRLRHCCERNVFSALHTLALNATLSGGVECVRTLMDVMDLDLLATRITCELAEILFRFDCRQVYSLIHQCEDCKESYRRWVCSTLVPYFAEEGDISVSPSYNNNRNSSKSNRVNKENSNQTLVKDITTNKTSLLLPNLNYQNELKDFANSNRGSAQRTKRQMNQNLAFLNTSSIDNNIVAPIRNLTSTVWKRSKRNMDDECNRHQHQPQQGQQMRSQQLKQSNIFISTAINADPYNEDPVISKIIKRSKRKVIFRKRRRIRPCLSVCQTVEQKCPYLLPADRAPALPTQYAGEPTFLCLDQSIPETGEQLRKSSYGPAECCYSYCNNIADGICASCNEFIQDKENFSPIVSSTPRLHNITLTATGQYRLDARLEATLAKDSTNKMAASISIALKNRTATAVSGQIDRLQYYALYDGIYYYDENTADMPEAAISDDCPPVPSVTSRCSIPYYASSAVAIRLQQKTVPKDVSGHHMLLLLSAMLCLLTSQTAAIQLKSQTHPNQKLRKYILQSSKHFYVRHSPSRVRYKLSSAIFATNEFIYLADHSAIKQEIQKIAWTVSSLENFTEPTILYISSDIYEINTSSISRSVHECGRLIHCCIEKNRKSGNTKCKSSKVIKQRSQELSGHQNRNRLVSVNKTTNGKWNGKKTAFSTEYGILNRLNENYIRSTKYRGYVRYNYVQMNIGNNNKITYRLNSQLYFNSNTKIYRRKKSSKIRNFNIATMTDYTKYHKNDVIEITTSNLNNYLKTKENLIYCNYTNNCKSNNKDSIDRFYFNNAEKNYQIIYYYNFNINDWWRRWWRSPWTWSTLRQPLVIL
ncbi:uncharacterized protein LOC120771965 [Bactrocera tryoni]|uniref:uncharacterized protein LOC120771965 n=1 Tax=Bactrocera tryoni TaxID=59916 RepID=UPI001A96810C|nr:uncharacterized protein LOC120771965 [Bactrocera tryoni]